MGFNSRQNSGAMLMQVIIGLGIMAVMTPVIMTQVREYNRRVAREEAVAYLQRIQRSASGYISFSRERIPVGCEELSGEGMTSALGPYGGAELATSNSLGQDYFLYICKIRAWDGSENVIAYAGARGGDLPAAELAALGEYMLDQGGIVDKDGDFLSNYEIEVERPLLEHMRSRPGSVVMMVSGAAALTDYLHIDPPASGAEKDRAQNTMSVDLDMGGNDIRGAADMNGEAMSAESSVSVQAARGASATLLKESSVGKVFESVSNQINHDSSAIPIEAAKLYIERLNLSGSAQVRVLDMEGADLIAGALKVGKMRVFDDMEILGDAGGIKIASLAADDITSDGTAPIEADEVVLREGGHIIGGSFVGGKLVEEEAVKIMPDGISEVNDVCWGNDCLSTEVLSAYEQLQTLLDFYTKVAGR